MPTLTMLYNDTTHPNAIKHPKTPSHLIPPQINFPQLLLNLLPRLLRPLLLLLPILRKEPADLAPRMYLSLDRRVDMAHAAFVGCGVALAVDVVASLV